MAAKKPATLKRQARKPSGKPTERVGVPQPHGGVLIPGAGGGPQPGSGRPKDEFKARMRALTTREETEAALESILSNKDHPHFMKAYAFAAEHGYGKATEHVEVAGKDGGPIAMTVTFRK